MGRPVRIDEAKLLEAARDVFLRKGVSATAADVARRAGISEASIFKRYGTKQELFLSAMRAERERRQFADELRERAAQVGLREALVDLGVELIGFVSRVLPLALVSWSNRGAFGLPEDATGRDAPFRNAEQVVTLLRGEMRAGRLRPQDPWTVVRTFLGAVQHYVLVERCFKQRVGPARTPRAYMRRVVGLLWEGLGPAAPWRRNA